MRTNVKSAERILDLLELMAVLGRPIRLNDAARRLGIPKSSASGLFATLAAKGYVTSSAEGFSLVQQHHMGWVGGDYAHLARICRPIMIRLAADTGESAFLGIRTSDWNIQYIDKITSSKAVRYDVDLSFSRPAYGTSIGHVFLAEQSDEELDTFFSSQTIKQDTPYTVTDRDALMGMINRVRERGYAEVERTHAVDTAGVAAGIRGTGGRLIAGLSVIAPVERFAAIREHAIVAVMAAAAEASEIYRTRMSDPSPRPRQQA